MEIKDIALLFGIAVTWDAIWVHFVVVKFFSIPDDLFNNYESSGVTASAHSFIESQRLIPILARIFEQANKQQEGQQRKIATEELLNASDYINDLKDLENAMQDKKKIDDTYNFLTSSSGRLWKVGLLHVILALLIPISFFLNSTFLLAMLFSLAIVSFIWVIVELYRYNQNRNTFLTLLRKNKFNANA